MKSALDGGHQSVDVGGNGAEEIEITSLTLDIPSGDKCRPSGKGKLLRLRKFADDRCDSALQGRQHAISILRCFRIHAAHA